MSKNKKNLSNKQLEEIIFANIFQVVDDDTGNSSYRKYFDKVLKDIFGIDWIITTFMMSRSQFKMIHQMMNNPDLKPFCQMMLREEDVKILHEMVRVAYDAAQIALKPKKNVSSGDIKAYQYLSKLYTEGIKTLRKKYNQEKSAKKKYKNKYSNLSNMLGKKTAPTYNLSLLDDPDDDPNDIFDDEDDEDEDDSQFNTNGFDLDDLPTRFMISDDDLWNPPSSNKRKSSLRYVSDDDTEDTEGDSHLAFKSSEDLVMPEGQFQRYAISIFERLLKTLDNQSDSMEESDGNMEEGSIPDSDSEIPVVDSKDSENVVTNDLVNNQIKELTLTETSVFGTSHDSVTLEETKVPTKDYKDMTREECINEFNKNSGVVPKTEPN